MLPTTNEATLNKLIERLENFDEKFLNVSFEILKADNQNMYTTDLLSCAVSNRAIQLLNGYNTLIGVNNYLCAIPLIRLQLDNALRFFAINLVDNKDVFFNHFLDGLPIGTYKSFDGKPLSDNYLAKKVNDLFPGIYELYKNVCGHIHLSDQHLFATRGVKKAGQENATTQVGRGLDPFNLDLKINFCSAMFEVCTLVHIVLNQWKLEKENINKTEDSVP